MNDLACKLALATCTLLGAGHAAAQAEWSLDTSHLSYREMDDRVNVRKSLAQLQRTLDDGSMSVTLVHDTMSGASPTGALRGNNAVTYSGASGGAGFSTEGEGGDSSLSQFEDTRMQAGLARDWQWNRLTRINAGATVSREDDYDSFGGNIELSRENRTRSRTWTTGFAMTSDTIYRSDEGTTPIPLEDASSGLYLSQGERNTVDGLIGVTQVLNRRTLAQFNLSVSVSNGYHSDPYKIISAADEQGVVVANLHESRPESRQRTSLYGKLVHQVNDRHDSIHLSYRWYQDDWGIGSHTTELRYHRPFNEKHYLEPQLRLYRQGQADFYQRSLGVDDSLAPLLPQDGYVSADYRLDAQTSYTVGLKYGYRITPRASLRLRAAWVDKQFDDSEYASNDSTLLQSSFRYEFR